MDIGPSYLDFSISSSLFMLLTMVEKRGLKLPCISFSDAVQNRNYSADVIHPSFATERRFVRVILPAFLRNANFGGVHPKMPPLTHPLSLFERRDEMTQICLTKL